MSVGHLNVSFGKVSIHVFCPFLHWIICFSGVEFGKFFIDFGSEWLKLTTQKQQMLARMQRNGNSLALLTGMQTGAATLENSMEVSQKVTNRAAL